MLLGCSTTLFPNLLFKSPKSAIEWNHDFTGLAFSDGGDLFRQLANFHYVTNIRGTSLTISSGLSQRPAIKPSYTKKPSSQRLNWALLVIILGSCPEKRWEAAPFLGLDSLRVCRPEVQQ